MTSEELLVNTLRAIKNRFWTPPGLVELCVKKGLVRLRGLVPELTAEGQAMLRKSDDPEA